jgi:hypothetical protein
VRGQTFDRPTAGVCNPYHREFAANEIGDRLKRESDGKQSIHVAAVWRNG